MSLIIATTGGISSLEVGTGNVIKAYKSSEPIACGSAVLNSGASPSTLLVAQRNKPLIHVYQLRKEAIMKRIVMPSKLSAISLSPCGRWLAAGSQDGTIYVWNMQSSALLTLQTEAHFQAVTSLVWSSDSHILVSGGADARVLVWRSTDLIVTPGKPPKHIFTSHSLPVVSMKIGSGTFREARLFTASLDSTCCVFDIFSGTLLYTLVADAKITAMDIDPAERAVYLGCIDGIHAVPLYYESPESKKLVAAGSAEGSVISTNSIERIFKSASETTSPFTTFTVSPNGIHLISGSEDGTVATWEVGSGQLLRNYRATKGSICQILYETKDFSSSEIPGLSMLQRNAEGVTEITDFIPPADQTGQLYSENFDDAEDLAAEIDEIFKEGQTNSTKSEKETTHSVPTEDNDPSSADELQVLKQRYAQLKKMYDELWSKYAAGS